MPKSKSTHGLAGLPVLMPLEAPASWLTRAALSQGETVASLLAHLNLFKIRDFDLAIASDVWRQAAVRSGMYLQFELAAKIFDRVKGLGTDGSRLLLTTQAGRPRYRFCPQCLRAQRERYIEMHCRFVPWRFCPTHHCLLEDACPHCQQPVVLPFDMICAGPKRSGVAYLSQCQSCAGSLTAVEPVEIDDLCLSEWDYMLLANGRATLAALRDGWVCVDDRVEKRLSHLKGLAKMGLIPMREDWLAASAARQTLALRQSVDRERE
ncbi:hypothetical protein D3C87_1331810 [compost metagenome]